VKPQKSKIPISICLFTIILIYAIRLPSIWAQNKPGYLVIQSMENSIKIEIDNKFIGQTPFDQPIPVSAGEHIINASKVGYKSLEFEFKVDSRKTTELLINLIPSFGIVKFDCNIHKSEVYVDNKLIGNTPLIIDVLIGDHRVQITKEGYNDYIENISVSAGKKYFIKGELTPFKDFSPKTLAMLKTPPKPVEPSVTLDPAIDEKHVDPVTENKPIEPAAAWYSDLHKKWWLWTILTAAVTTAVVLPLTLPENKQAGINQHDSSFWIQLP
jgi:hypothetical protein